MRGHVGEDQYNKVKKGKKEEDFRDMQMMLVNKYINAYSDKLSPRTEGQKINLDKANFETFVTETKAGHYNPYRAYMQVKNLFKEPLHEIYRRKQAEKANEDDSIDFQK